MATVSDQNDASPHSAIYSPLTRSQVRFIEIIPSGPVDEQVSCRLETMELSEDIRYAALSYVWGESNITEGVLVNGINLPVTTNLASALRHFRKHGFPYNMEIGKIQRLWVDAICINQKDIREKGHQVPLMGRLYANASSVLSWLGAPDSSHLDKALRIIHDIAPVIGATPDHPEIEPTMEMIHAGFKWLNSTLGTIIDRATNTLTTKWAPLQALGRSMYWKRAWIIQEIVLANAKMELCQVVTSFTDQG
ncbi:heterokaryon incompatibility protein-domain-containing protein [Xylaria cubensis]|nr:heterokaryon incompatibility protein-domain-containing protein [Xylaria cubensis]